MTKTQWNKKCSDFLVGKTIRKCDYLTQEEVDQMGWYGSCLAIEFTDGSYIFPMQDDEGNGPGAMATSSTTLPIIPVIG